MNKYIIEFQDKGGNELFSRTLLFRNIKVAKFWASEFVATTSIQDLHKAKAKRIYGK